MTSGAAVHGCALVLAHAPDLVRHGSKPARHPDQLEAIAGHLRSFDEVLAYPPHQVFVGNLRPEALWDIPRPWSKSPATPAGVGPFGVICDQDELYARMAAADHFDLFQLGTDAPAGAHDLELFRDGKPAGVMRAAHDADESLHASVLLENLGAKATGTLALEQLLTRTGVAADAVEYAIGCGEEAVGDRYQRGGGNLGKAIAEQAGCSNAGGADVKAFCAGPLHAIVTAAALVTAGVYDTVAVVAGGSLAKLGMKFQGALAKGGPILEDTLAGLAILVGRADGNAPHVRLDAVGRHRVVAGSAQQALLGDLVAAPLERIGRTMRDIDTYATELHDPDITEPAGAGNVPERSYKMLGALAVMRGEIGRSDIETFAHERGLPGFSPTQGHVASAVPWLPHGLARLRGREIGSTMLLAKGSLFLGRMTELADGLSVIIEGAHA